MTYQFNTYKFNSKFMVKSDGLCILVFSFLKLEFNFGGEHNCDFNTKYEITVYHTVSVSGTYIQFSTKKKKSIS